MQLELPTQECLPTYYDDRGFFKEIWKNDRESGRLDINRRHYQQDNFSYSKKNVFRGFHFQNPNPQGKLVTVFHGRVIDIVIDLRKDSDTFKEYFVYVLSGENNNQLYVPEGFAHGFISMEDNTCFFYKNTNIYCKECEQCLAYDDPDIDVDWGQLLENPSQLIISEKDKQGKTFKQLEEEDLLF